MSPALLGIVTVSIGVGGCLAYFYLSNLLLDRVLFPAHGPNAGRYINRAEAGRSWLFLLPALAALALHLAYSVVETMRLLLLDRDNGNAVVGAANYAPMAFDDKFWEAVANNAMWLAIVPASYLDEIVADDLGTRQLQCSDTDFCAERQAGPV